MIWGDNWRSARRFINNFLEGLSETNELHHVKLLGSLNVNEFTNLPNVEIEALDWVPDLHKYLSEVKYILVPEFKNFGLNK